ncbi:glycosyltransferase family 4 protein [Roseibium suaedae]|uniref:Glycosyltransferase involved in cell wall bisynthesis n=1 Tax=Roseibium suaedae TaxID=735517 RepID=A0A1M7N0T2_9HYPH|nr:glycosyltransferase family 4 protein [Roseibium suaedae]SHM97097.1 Glycosyltransferase involved in cell wall bisynthesis [Roseibium suaedae]
MQTSSSARANAPVILQVIPDLETGGAERTTVDVAAAILAAGWTAVVVSQGGRLVPELEALGAIHITLPVKSKNPLTLWRNAARLQEVIRKHKVSLVHARSRAPAWSALWASRREKLPFVTTYHGIYNQSNAFKAFYNSVMARADRVIANSHYTASLIMDRHPFAKDRITVIHRGSDLESLAPASISTERKEALAAAWGLEPGRPVVVNLARLTNWKGQGIIIDAMAQLKQAGDSRTVAVLAGDAQGRDSYLSGLKDQIVRHGLEDQVLLPGHCADVPAAMALADVAVVASIEPEAFGRAAVEAQAGHVPVIVSNLGAVPETVLAPPEVPEDQRTGWRVPPGDAEALASALRHALDLPEGQREALVARALAHVSKSFSLSAMCSATLDVYRSLLR